MLLVQDLLYHIHALMPMRDAACAASVSWGFLHSWGSFPNLIFDIETLGINDDDHKIDEITTDFITRVDRIMQNHSGIGVKIFRLRTYHCAKLPMCILAMLTVGFKLLSHLVLKNLNCECPGRTRLSTNFHVHYYLAREEAQCTPFP